MSILGSLTKMATRSRMRDAVNPDHVVDMTPAFRRSPTEPIGEGLGLTGNIEATRGLSFIPPTSSRGVNTATTPERSTLFSWPEPPKQQVTAGMIQQRQYSPSQPFGRPEFHWPRASTGRSSTPLPEYSIQSNTVPAWGTQFQAGKPPPLKEIGDEIIDNAMSDRPEFIQEMMIRKQQDAIDIQEKMYDDWLLRNHANRRGLTGIMNYGHNVKTPWGYPRPDKPRELTSTGYNPLNQFLWTGRGSINPVEPKIPRDWNRGGIPTGQSPHWGRPNSPWYFEEGGRVNPMALMAGTAVPLGAYMGYRMAGAPPVTDTLQDMFGQR